MNNPLIKIIHADDQQLFRTGVRTALADKKDIEIIGEAVNGAALLQLLEHLQPDIIILNIQMPVMDGIKTLPILKKRYPGIKVIMLSMHSDPALVCRMIELGASSYLTKEAGSEKLYEAILGCYKNWFFISDTVRYALTGTTPGFTNGFADKQILLLELLEQGKQIKNICDILDLSPRTVGVSIENLKKKTGTKTNEELIAFAIRNKIIASSGIYDKLTGWFT